jgi:hypothetical protein
MLIDPWILLNLVAWIRETVYDGERSNLSLKSRGGHGCIKPTECSNAKIASVWPSHRTSKIGHFFWRSIWHSAKLELWFQQWQRRQEAFIGRRLREMSTSTMTGSQATEALLHSPIPALRKLRVEVSDSGMVLSGSVPTYYLKQLAQETILPFLECRDLVNRITVTRPS